VYGQYKLQTIRSVTFAGLRSNVIFVQKTFDWGGEMVLIVEKCRDWATIGPQISRQHWGTLAHWI